MDDALLAAVCAQPDDLSARLVYADYLLEQSDPAKRDRGEFILAQCRLAAGGLGNEEWSLRRRAKELLDQYREAWLAPLAQLVSNAAFHCGFPDRVTMTGDQFAGGFAEVSKLTPVARLHLARRTVSVADVAACPELSGVAGLDLSGEVAGADGLRELLASPHLTRLTYLNVSGNMLGDAGMDVLAGSPVLHQLTQLSVAGNGVTSAGVGRLVNALTTGRVPNLRWLNLRRNHLTKGTWADVLLAVIPPRTPATLRMSLEGQLRRYCTIPPTDDSPLARMKAAAYSREIKELVTALDVKKATHLAAAIKAHPLPPEVHRAFTALCGRRLEWAVRRFEKGRPVPPTPATDTPRGLAELVELVCNRGGIAADLVAVWLRDWLLRLIELHLGGHLDPEGRTR